MEPDEGIEEIQPRKDRQTNKHVTTVRVKLNGIVNDKCVIDNIAFVSKEMTEVSYIATRLLNLYVIDTLTNAGSVELDQNFIRRTLSICSDNRSTFNTHKNSLGEAYIYYCNNLIFENEIITLTRMAVF